MGIKAEGSDDSSHRLDDSYTIDLNDFVRGEVDRLETFTWRAEECCLLPRAESSSWKVSIGEGAERCDLTCNLFRQTGTYDCRKP